MGRIAPSAETAPKVRLAEAGDADAVAALLDALGYPCTGNEAADRIAASTCCWLKPTASSAA